MFSDLDFDSDEEEEVQQQQGGDSKKPKKKRKPKKKSDDGDNGKPEQRSIPEAETISYEDYLARKNRPDNQAFAPLQERAHNDEFFAKAQVKDRAEDLPTFELSNSKGTKNGNDSSKKENKSAFQDDDARKLLGFRTAGRGDYNGRGGDFGGHGRRDDGGRGRHNDGGEGGRGRRTGGRGENNKGAGGRFNKDGGGRGGRGRGRSGRGGEARGGRGRGRSNNNGGRGGRGRGGRELNTMDLSAFPTLG